MSTERKILYGIVAGVAITLVFGRSGAYLVLALMAVAAIVGLLRWRRDKPKQSAALTPSCTPEQAAARTTIYMAQRGYAIAHAGQATATFTRPKKPNLDVGILLLLLGIIPGLLYFGLFRGTQAVSLAALETQEGSEIIISGDDREGRDTLSRWIRENL